MYTLDQLAWYNRCLFPDNLYRDILEVGGDEGMAMDARNYVKRNPKAGILGLYQEYITDKEFIDVLEKLVYNFINSER